MAFGAKQLKNPTPSNFVWGVRVYTAIAGAFMGWMPTVAFIPHSFQDIATPILGFTITIANVVLPFFGVETNEKRVDIKDVGSMEQPYSAPKDDELKNK